MDTFESLCSDCECLSAQLVAECVKRGATVSTAESLTAGMVSSFVAGVPGASSVLSGGAVTYTNEIKESLLGVSAKTIAEVTEVSAEVAAQMAEGAVRAFDSTYAVSLTGYAGPGGGTQDNPVGTVYMGLCGPDGVQARCFHFSGDRQVVRVSAARVALSWLVDSVRCV